MKNDVFDVLIRYSNVASVCFRNYLKTHAIRPWSWSEMLPNYLFVFLLLLSFVTEKGVEGAQCQKSFGWLKCSPCGRGTRCLFCNWCTGFCNNSHRRKRDSNNGFVEVLYKLPFLEMFDDLSTLIYSTLIKNQNTRDEYYDTKLAIESQSVSGSHLQHCCQ